MYTARHTAPQWIKLTPVSDTSISRYNKLRCGEIRHPQRSTIFFSSRLGTCECLLMRPFIAWALVKPNPFRIALAPYEFSLTSVALLCQRRRMLAGNNCIHTEFLPFEATTKRLRTLCNCSQMAGAGDFGISKNAVSPFQNDFRPPPPYGAPGRPWHEETTKDPWKIRNTEECQLGKGLPLQPRSKGKHLKLFLGGGLIGRAFK